jgi:hypothetical protein
MQFRSCRDGKLQTVKKEAPMKECVSRVKDREA